VRAWNSLQRWGLAVFMFLGRARAAPRRGEGGSSRKNAIRGVAPL
jgi:hypothetical protein